MGVNANGLVLGVASLLVLSGPCFAQTNAGSFPPYLARGFDYASFTRFDAATPPKNLIYQSNGFMALQEKGFGGQIVIVPVSGDAVPTNSTDRLLAVAIDAPVFAQAGGTYNLADSPARRHVTYYADRTVYHAEFDAGPEVSLTVYPVYGKSASVLRIRIEKASGPVRVSLNTGGMGFQFASNQTAKTDRKSVV